ncbi:MAG: HAD-IIA family hydrolase [Candidatus Micrarchaeota archaeon]|nr:HAD-IIA family hydrolase [Candidatus Micrarchaeota archaeon]
MVSAIVFDLDGVVYLGAQGIPGVAGEIARLQKRTKVLFLTNNATKSRQSYVHHLARYGIKANKNDVMTASFGCAHYVKEKYGAGKRVFVIGEQGLHDELVKEAGAKIVEKNAEFVVVGLDRQVTYEKLDKGLHNLVTGAKFILANSDPTLPREHGASPGSGAIAAALIYASGKKPDAVIGKPSVYLIKKLLQMHKVKPREAVFVGDRLEIDIRMANEIGMKSVLVLTGVAKRSDVKRAPKSDKPGIVIESAAKVGKVIGI